MIAALAAVIVLSVSYLLILPARTLEVNEAEKQGGISVTTDQSKETEQDRKTEDTKESGPETYKSGELSYAGKTFDIEASYGKKAQIPEETRLKVREIGKKDDAYTDYYKKVVEAVKKEKKDEFSGIQSAQFYDISLMAAGKEIEPSDELSMTISYDKGIPVEDGGLVRVVHFKSDEKSGKVRTEVLEEEKVEAVVKESKLSKASFSAESFSVYGVVTLEPQPEEEDDPLGLDGKSYGVINNQDTISGTALMTGSATVSNKPGLKGYSLTVRTDPIKRNSNVFVAKNSSINMWSFHSAGDGAYYMTTVVSGTLKYLKISSSGVSLVDTADEDCRITITPGTGSNKGKYRFTGMSASLRLSGSNFEASTKNDASAWMNLAELSTLGDDDFVTYSATKVSVSDTVNVKDGDQLILYTRIWNEDTLKYEYYAIDYDGMLVRAYESGDTISWVGSKINTMLWKFTEHHNDDGTLNYYYDFQNSYSEKYIAPVASGGSILSDNPIGVNLNGRRNGAYYTPIVAWDDPSYDYFSLMVDNGKLVSAPFARANDFYFAVMKPAEEESELTTVETFDHKPYGITIKMQDYEHINGSNRSQEQVDVLGNTPFNQWTGSQGLLEKNMTGDYPKATKSNRSLGELYSKSVEVNQLFLEKTHSETGYFEYDSTQNFAHLITSADDYWYGRENPSGGTYGIGDFVVYKQLGTSNEGNKDTLRHGQFLPYNDLVDSKGDPIAVSKKYTNERDIHADPLSSLDPRKGEALYEIPQKTGQTAPNYVDHFFGMEMSASFIQNESGLDEWGHDLVFEFSGDDDFWLYVDNMLVLDLGGIHSALDGSINFRTGKVIVNKKETTLRELYKAAYKDAHAGASDSEINEWLNTIFDDDGSNKGTVFKDYTGHTMRMFYMERGAGASNLHMRFNLAPYTPGEVQLGKEVSGTDNIGYADARFPFQIYYRDPDSEDDEFKLLTDVFKVTDAQTGKVVSHQDTYTVGDRTYQDVFFLKPDQTVSIRLPSEDTEYYIKECAVDHETYDEVHINRAEEALDPTEDTAGLSARDYQIDDSKVVNRKKVIFDNHVNSKAAKSLTIRKFLWADYDKNERLHDDDTGFRFRIYIGKSEGKYSTYGFGRYYVKNADGEYCIYQNGSFVSTGKKKFDELSTEVEEGQLKSEQEKATFHTSQGGAADKIPADYSVEIPGLMNGTPFLIEEREDEIPSGYELIDYELTGGEYTVDEERGDTSNYGVIRTNQEDPVVTVNNQHGYGLTVKKHWSDDPFMDSHDDIYMGVFIKDGDTLTLLQHSVRCLHSPSTSYTWFFPKLAGEKTLDDYIVCELDLEGENISVDPKSGEVSGWTDLTRLEKNDTLTVGGVSNERGYSQDYTYTVDYLRGHMTENKNARTDSVFNSRPGIKLVKTDVDGHTLKGAVFQLTAPIGEGAEGSAGLSKAFTTDEEGLIAVAYLEPGKEYTLTETSSPAGYQALIDSITLRAEVAEDGTYTVFVNNSDEDDSEEPARYTVSQVNKPTALEMPVVTVRNRAFTVKAKKTDAYTGYALEEAKFSLYKQKKDYHTGELIPDYNPMEGFEELITDSDGIIPLINIAHLKAGTYYLREKEALPGYKALGGDIQFTISDQGMMTLDQAPKGAAEITHEDQDGVRNYTLIVKNTPKKSVRILKKTDNAQEPILAGTGFDLYKVGQIEDGQPKPGEKPILSGVTGSDGILKLGVLEEGITYYLFETDVPDSQYAKLDKPVTITVTGSKVTAKYADETLAVKKVSGSNEAEIWEITVVNHVSVMLPASGGPGTALYIILGLILTLGAGALLLLKRRRMHVAVR